MRKLLLCASALALLLTAEKASAQASWGLAAGATLPMGDLGDVSGTGFHAGVLLNTKPAAFPVGLRFEGGFTQFAEDVAPKINVLSGAVNAVVEAAGVMPTKPFLIGGLGMYNTKVSGGGSGNTDFGINVGGGLKFALSGMSTFVELRYVNIMSDPSTSYLPISFGITW